MHTNDQIVLLFWIVFAGTHLVSCLSFVRKFITHKIGEDTYARNTGTLLWDMTHHNFAYMFFREAALVFLFQSVINPSPAELESVKDNQIIGIVRVTRHAQFFASVLFAAGGIFDKVYVVDAIFLFGFPIFFILGVAHQELRQKNTKPKYYFQQTSVLPFKAIIEGRNSLLKTIQELDVIALVVAIVLGVVFTYYPLSSVEHFLTTNDWSPFHKVQV